MCYCRCGSSEWCFLCLDDLLDKRKNPANLKNKAIRKKNKKEKRKYLLENIFFVHKREVYCPTKDVTRNNRNRTNVLQITYLFGKFIKCFAYL